MIDVTRADRINGPLLVLEGFGDAAYGELVEVTSPTGTHLGEVLSAGTDAAIVELWGDTTGLRADDVRVRFRGETLHLGVAREMLGRVFDGLGRPRDGLPPVVAEARLDVHGAPLNPAARDYPRDVIETGISAVDGLNTLVRGQKLPIFSGAGLPHDELASQIALQARLSDTDERFAVVFVALGISHDTAAYFRERFASSGLLGRTALFLNLADDPPMERIVTPRAALTLAEFLAFERDMHVLVLMTDMTNYAEALRELSARKNEVPGRKGYPGYLYTDLAGLYERCGRARGRSGSLTQIPVLTMPGDDVTHPIPDLTGYITEGQVVLSRALHRAGVYPPVDVPASLSRLMKDGIGEGRTRDDHAEVAAQLFAAYARVREVRNLALIIGESALSATDRTYLAFGTAFEHDVLAQRQDEARPLERTLDLAWEALAKLPADELHRISEKQLQRRYRGKLDRGGPHAGARAMAVDAQLPRTRSSLLQLRQSLTEAREGHALLERKREVLLREVWELMRAARQHEGRVRERFDAAHAALRAARLDAGSEAVRWALLAPSAQTSCRVDVRNLMGVALPSIDLTVIPERLTTSAGGTPVALDATRRRWLEVAEVLAVWAETYGSVWRVAAELARTQRRVAALEQVLIPELEEGIRAIEETLEEADREGFVRTKRVKARLEQERSEADRA